MSGQVAIESTPKSLPSLSDKDHEAITLFQNASEKESLGMMSEAIDLYRKAYKLNEQVDILYREREVPQASHRLKQEVGKNILKKVDEQKVKKINVTKLLDSFEGIDAHAPDPNNPDDNEEVLTIKFANLGQENREELADIKPISPLTRLPHDIWWLVFEILVLTSPEAWFKMSITCKKFAHLGLASSDIWRKLCYLVYNNQTYVENQYVQQIPEDQESQENESREHGEGVFQPNLVSLPGNTLVDMDLPIPRDLVKILPQYNDSWKNMFHNRPFIKFLGCYISVVNYHSEGGNAVFTNSWTNPIRIITYYRYLRFYPDGTCIKLLTTLAPDKVVPYFLKTSQTIDPLHTQASRNQSDLTHTQVVTAISKESHRIFHGKWTISSDGEVNIKIENGSVPYYIFHYNFNIKSVGGISKFNKLTWSNFFGIRKQMTEDDDREGEITSFAIRNEKPFKFLRVKSYNVDN
jgi:hypothetical protein